VDAPVIFTTAYDEYAIRAFKLKSIDYLLKPVSQEDLNAAMNKFKAWTGKDDQQQKLAELFHLILDKGRQYRDRFSVTVGEKLKTIEVGNISYFFSVSGISFVVMNDNRQYSLDLSLEKLAEELNPKDFFRVNRQYLLSHKSLSNVFIYPKSRLKLELNPAAREDVFVSIDKVSEFKRWLDGRGHEGGIPS
jgi:DNA-binding LytR/AlgR family response regulator